MLKDIHDRDTERWVTFQLSDRGTAANLSVLRFTNSQTGAGGEMIFAIERRDPVRHVAGNYNDSQSCGDVLPDNALIRKDELIDEAAADRPRNRLCSDGLQHQSIETSNREEQDDVQELFRSLWMHEEYDSMNGKSDIDETDAKDDDQAHWKFRFVWIPDEYDSMDENTDPPPLEHVMEREGQDAERLASNQERVCKAILQVQSLVAENTETLYPWIADTEQLKRVDRRLTEYVSSEGTSAWCRISLVDPKPIDLEHFSFDTHLRLYCDMWYQDPPSHQNWELCLDSRSRKRELSDEEQANFGSTCTDIVCGNRETARRLKYAEGGC